MMAGWTPVFVLVLSVIGGLPQFGNAIGSLVVELPERTNEMILQSSLVFEIMGVFGSGAIEDRLSDMTESLRPMFSALPKNEYGNLGHSTVRYALHRLFVQRHGWSVKGLDPAGGSWNSSSPVGILKGRVPAHIHSMFEQSMDGHGLSLHEVAVLASVLEHLAHVEAKKRLVKAVKALQLVPGVSMSADTVPSVLDEYMKTYILGGESADVNITEMNVHYPHWESTQKYVRQTLTEVTLAERGRTTRFGEDYWHSSEVDFDFITRVVDRLGEGYGHFQDEECQQLKSKLLRLEDSGTGRVPLVDFYTAALDGEGEFSESILYLRELGALDESDPQKPSVFVANYLASPSNCIASSALYSVCCMDECESLVGHLEKSIAAPHADPSRLAELVASLASPTVSAPRNISATLRQRLDEIAASNGGAIPLHGRLFAQWMHHAFPRECPYPHVSGSTKQRTPEEWEKETGSTTIASAFGMQLYVVSQRTSVAAKDDGEAPALMWSMDEELLTIRSTFSSSSPSDHWSSMDSMGRSMMFLVAVSAMVTGMLRSTEPIGKTLTGEPHKVYV